MDLNTLAAEQPNKPAHILGSTGERVTYAELNERSLQFAHLLREAGLRQGDTLAFQMENNLRIFEVVWGALRSGLYCAQIETSFPADKVAHILRDSAASVFVTDIAHAETASEMLRAVPQLAHRLMIGGTVSGYHSFEDDTARQPTVPLNCEPEGRVINYSGGSTGMPKAVRGQLSGRLLSDPAPEVLNRAKLWGYSAETVQLCAAPTTRLLMAYSVMAQRFGGTVVINDSSEPLDVLRFIERYRVTHLQALPLWFLKLHKDPSRQFLRFDLSSLEYICHAGAPCPTALKAEMMEAFGPIIHEYYSGSEGAGMTYISPSDWLEHPGSVGRAIIGNVHIVGADGKEVAPGRPGKIYFEGGPRFEYHNLPEKTAEAYDEHGWATLGDVGSLDEDGYLFLLDRADFVLRLGGQDIYTQPIENELVMIPEVGDAAVLSLRKDQLLVLIEPCGPDQPDKRVAQAVAQVVAGMANVPQEIVTVRVVAGLERPATGKLNKAELRRRFGHLANVQS